jgi:hypothetical protein
MTYPKGHPIKIPTSSNPLFCIYNPTTFLYFSYSHIFFSYVPKEPLMRWDGIHAKAAEIFPGDAWPGGAAHALARGCLEDRL